MSTLSLLIQAHNPRWKIQRIKIRCLSTANSVCKMFTVYFSTKKPVLISFSEQRAAEQKQQNGIFPAHSRGKFQMAELQIMGRVITFGHRSITKWKTRWASRIWWKSQSGRIYSYRQNIDYDWLVFSAPSFGFKGATIPVKPSVFPPPYFALSLFTKQDILPSNRLCLLHLFADVRSLRRLFFILRPLRQTQNKQLLWIWQQQLLAVSSGAAGSVLLVFVAVHLASTAGTANTNSMECTDYLQKRSWWDTEYSK